MSSPSIRVRGGGGGTGGPVSGITQVQLNNAIAGVPIERVAVLPPASAGTLRRLYILPDGSYNFTLAQPVSAGGGTAPAWQEFTQAVASANSFQDRYIGVSFTTSAFRSDPRVQNRDVSYIIGSNAFFRAVVTAGQPVQVNRIDPSDFLPTSGWTWRDEYNSEDDASANIVLGRNLVFWVEDSIYTETLHFSANITTLPTVAHTEHHWHKLASLDDLAAFLENTQQSVGHRSEQTSGFEFLDGTPEFTDHQVDIPERLLNDRTRHGVGLILEAEAVASSGAGSARLDIRNGTTVIATSGDTVLGAGGMTMKATVTIPSDVTRLTVRVSRVGTFSVQVTRITADVVPDYIRGNTDGSLQAAIQPQTVQRTGTTDLTVAAPTGVAAGAETTIPLDVLGTGSILSSLDTTEESVLVTPGVYIVEADFMGVKNAVTSNRFAVGFVVQRKNDDDSWTTIATSQSIYVRGVADTDDELMFIRPEVRFSVTASTRIRMRALSLPSWGIPAVALIAWTFQEVDITFYAIGGVAGEQGEAGDASSLNLPARPDHTTEAKKYNLNVPATSGAATWTEDTGGGGSVTAGVIRGAEIARSAADLPTDVVGGSIAVNTTWTKHADAPAVIAIGGARIGFNYAQLSTIPANAQGVIAAAEVNGVETDWVAIPFGIQSSQSNTTRIARFGSGRFMGMRWDIVSNGSTQFALRPYGFNDAVPTGSRWKVYWWVSQGPKGDKGDTGNTGPYGPVYFYWANAATERVTDGFPYTQDAAADNLLRFQFAQAAPNERVHATSGPASWFVAGGSTNIDSGGNPVNTTERVVFQPPAGTWKLKLYAGVNDGGTQNASGIGLFEVNTGMDDTVVVESLGADRSPGLFGFSGRNIIVVESDEITSTGSRQFYWMARTDNSSGAREADWAFYMRAEKVA